MPQQEQRAWIRLPSGRRLDLLNPSPMDWEDEDLAIGLSRTFRWGGHSRWPLPMSVAQHSLLVLAIREYQEGSLPRSLARYELLHDAEEGLLGFDCISPLKPFLGERFAQLSKRLEQAVQLRYQLPTLSEEQYAAHKKADIVAAASEALHIAGWTAEEIRMSLGIKENPLNVDPLAAIYGEEPWRPWEPEVAATRFLERLGF